MDLLNVIEPLNCPLNKKQCSVIDVSQQHQGAMPQPQGGHFYYTRYFSYATRILFPYDGYLFFQKFQKVCYVIEEKSQLLLSINNFLDETVVLPPGDWDRENQIGIKEILKLKEKKRQRLEAMEKLKRERDEEERMKLVCEDEDDEVEKEDVDKRLGLIPSNFLRGW